MNLHSSKYAATVCELTATWPSVLPTLYPIFTELRYSLKKNTLFIFSEEEKQDVFSKLEFLKKGF